jgi:ParB/RepB/Spo0J family partition protein
MKTAVKTAKDPGIGSIDENRGYRELLISQIARSPTEIQARRRAKFTKEEIAELATSIKANGLIQPITVRPVKGQAMPKGQSKHAQGIFEIVCGERRFLACQKAGLDRIDCVVRDLSDAAALDIQVTENLQRKDVDPIDEAYSFKALLTAGKYTVHDLAIKLGRSEKFITQRLRLNDLIPEILAEVSKGWLPIGHAMEISKFSAEMQHRIHKDEAAYEWKKGDDSDVLQLRDFKSTLKDEYLFSLKDAVFALDATNLREDGLACAACPERTGYEPLLFDEELKDGDSCLNEKCFVEKKKLFYQITRNDAASKLKVDAKTIGWATDGYFHGSEVSEKVHTYAKLYKTKACDKAKPVISLAKESIGQLAYICTDQKCSKHAARSSGSSANDEYAKQQKEREFLVQIANGTRRKIMLESASFFELRGFWADDELMTDLLQKLWNRELYQAKDIIDAWDPKAPTSSGDAEKVRTYLGGLNEAKRSQLVFLLLYGSRGFSSWSVADPAPVQAVNDRYAKLDYKAVEAEVRKQITAAEKPKAESAKGAKS